jgi:undecaprenyl phosphate-alpha-L-ara4N flippase subunit ArnE
MKTKPFAVFLMLICTILISVAQLLYKLGADKLEMSIQGILLNFLLIGGFALYVIGAGFMILAFKGGEVSVLYPILGTSYIWVTLLSWRVLGEMINVLKISGIIVIIIGVSFIGVGSRW